MLSQKNPRVMLKPHFFNIHFNFILPSMSRSYGWLLPSGFPTETLHAFHTSPIFATRPALLTFIDFITPIIFGEVQKL
jgi:hypothetical protein